MPHPLHPPRIDNSNYTWRRVQIMQLLVMQFSPPSHHFIPLQSKILLSTLFSNTLGPCSSLNVRDHASHPYRTTAKIIVLYILIFKYFESRLNGSKHYRNSVSSEFPPESNFDVLLSFLETWTVTQFQMICLLFLYPDFGLHSGNETPTFTKFSLGLLPEQPP
jgi:hypothetical protein